MIVNCASCAQVINGQTPSVSSVRRLLMLVGLFVLMFFVCTWQWSIEDAEIKVPLAEKPKVSKVSSFTPGVAEYKDRYVYLSVTFHPNDCCCNLFYDWRECVMSVLGTTGHS